MASSSNSDVSESESALTWNEDVVVELNRKNKPGVRLLRDQVQQYLEEAKLSDWDTPVLSWWGSNESKFPAIAKLARLVLAVPATSAASESAFSFSNLVISARRSSISPFHASQVLFVHDNYELVEKFLLQ